MSVSDKSKATYFHFNKNCFVKNTLFINKIMSNKNKIWVKLKPIHYKTKEALIFIRASLLTDSKF